jgi:4a-hydroxytetrahydrobiopterin dehydratase
MSSHDDTKEKLKTCSPCSELGGAIPLADVKEILGDAHPNWTLEGYPQHTINRQFSFKGYRHAMMFANAVAWIADRQGHHPDMTISYNQVGVSFSTHDVGGITKNDFICAGEVDRLYDS